MPSSALSSSASSAGSWQWIRAPGHVSISGYAELQLQFALWLEDNRENQNEGSNAYASVSFSASASADEYTTDISLFSY
jgi:hypothetical protein